MNVVSHMVHVVTSIPLVQNLSRKMQDHGAVFEKAYATNAWGSAESGSGTGSELKQTDGLRSELPALFKRHDVRSVLDVACGDWNWMRAVDLTGIDYVGLDVVESVTAENQRQYTKPGVRFAAADMTKDALPKSDLILCRDVWCYLSFQDIGAAIENFRSTGATWLLVSNSPKATKNFNRITGMRHLAHVNLQLPPFSFPQPVETLHDHNPGSPFDLRLYRIADIPAVRLS